MSTAAKNEKSVPGDSPVCGKSRGNRLARRARSFKEDFLEIISQMRSPGGSTTRSGSPCSPKSRNKTTDLVDGTIEKNPSKDLECNIRQAQLALKHFRDVVNKNKLEMLPGNGTVVLETVTAIHVLLKKYVLNEQSSILVSATNQVYQSLAKLIKLCDDFLLVGEKALGKENVTEVVNLVEDAIQAHKEQIMLEPNLNEDISLKQLYKVHKVVRPKNLVSLTKDKLILRDSNHKLGNDSSTNHVKIKPRALTENNLELGQRSSLPDIPLTPREREILERTSALALDRHSQSTENVLGDSPPPKPPHPDRIQTESPFPPPLPPKKRHKHLDDHIMGIKNSMECLSLRSKSPEDSSSLLSASAGSLDSVLNHCRDEDLTALIGQTEGIHNQVHTSMVQNYLENGYSQNYFWECSSSSAEQMPMLNSSGVSDSIVVSPLSVPEISSTDNLLVKLDRLSGSQAESGFSSMPSRSSSQSCSASSQHLSSTRSSQQSYTSQESHHTEKKITSTTESNKQKFHSVSVENNHNLITSNKIVTSSVSSEKLSFQKQTFSRQRTETSTSNEIFHTSHNSPSKKLDGLSCCLHEVKLQECPFHASLFSSPNRNSLEQGPTSGSSDDDRPPALPEKSRLKSKQNPYASQYDNLNETCVVESTEEQNCLMSHTVIEDGVVSSKQSSMSTMSAMNMNNIGGVTNVSQSDKMNGMIIESKTVGNVTDHSVKSMMCSSFQSNSGSEGNPPPLPPKKKHIMAYMEIFGNASHANANEFLRHSVHAYNLLQTEWQQHQKLLTSAQACSLTFSCDSSQTTPVRINECKSETGPSLPPALPPKKRNRSTTSSPPHTPTLIPEVDIIKREEALENHKETEIPLIDSTSENENLPVPSSSESKDLIANEVTSSDNEKEEIFLLDKLNVSEHLILKKLEDEGPDIRGGHPDALIIHATKAHKNDFLYQEAFLTTYRTFLTPLELIQKLCYRYEKFSSSQDSLKQRAARESFSLLVRVVSDLTLTDLNQVILQNLMEFVQQLLCRGDLTMAKALRVIMLSKYEAKKLYLNANSLLPSHNVCTRQSLLLDFKSEQIAEQMTLLDAELFLKIEIPEVLIWAQEQNEERSPNLTKFTEHFNKMSYWARSRILEQNDAKDREKYVVKFIKIMKHLRKINNFNSYLALLSALDSAPIRRLEWQKHITEGLKEYCALIDSSSSFRAYRQALAETNPPCIPYIGLVLQDLTFVHIGNTNSLPNGSINFSKRWQQFNIVENMKRFKKGSYPYKKNERIISFFNGFDDSLSEEAMWQISEKIKPRGGKKV